MKKEKEQIKVDKEFLDEILKTLKLLQEKIKIQEEEVNLIKKTGSLIPIINQPSNQTKEISKMLFWCVEITIKKDNQQANLLDFRKQLEELMKKNNVVSVSANLFAQL